MDAERAERLRALLRHELDWAYLADLARRHRVTPLLYRSLHSTCPEGVPRASLERLRAAFQTNSLRNQLRTRELLRLLALLDAHGIPCIPHKGPVVAVAAYGDLSLRQFADLDVLIHERDVPAARELLVAQNYRMVVTSFEDPSALVPAEEDQAAGGLSSFLGRFRILYDYSFVNDHNTFNTFLELHWRLLPWYFAAPVDSDRLWQNLEPLSLEGTTVRAFAPEDLLLILCIHGAKHHWVRLSMICDVAELVRVRRCADWGEVLGQARRLGSLRMLCLGLFLAQDLLGEEIPQELRACVRADPVVKRLARRVRDLLFQNPNDLGGPAEGRLPLLGHTINELLFHLRAKDRLRERVQYCFGLALGVAAESVYKKHLWGRVVYYLRNYLRSATG
jgi:hypothetical protein